MRPKSLLLLGCLAILAATTSQAFALRTSDRIQALTDYHGYFPCMDCHAEQEPVPTPRILQEEHYEPMAWEDDNGVTHKVAFGQKVSIGDLLGIGGGSEQAYGNLASGNLVRIGARLNINAYMKDHGLALTDSVWTLVHGGGNLWCLDCHDTVDRDKLIKLNKELLTFNQSHLLCGECHGPELRDWELGMHGKTTGFWDLSRDQEDVSLRLLCVDCHPPHNPAFPGVMPEAGPVTRLDGPGAHHPTPSAHSPSADKEGSH